VISIRIDTEPSPVRSREQEPHPLVPFVPVGVELVLIVDGETGLELTDVDVTMKPEPALGMTKGLVDPADLDKAVEQLLQLHGRAG
jgi:hypothetical protein